MVSLAEMKLQCNSMISIVLHFSQATQIFSDFSVFLRLFTRTSISRSEFIGKQDVPVSRII
jgi:hypothetical protein